MSFPLPPSKRPHDWNTLEPNGRGNWQNSPAFHPHNRHMKVLPDGTVFRVLCLAAKSGSVIGKGGNIIMQLRQETGAKVRVEETIPGCDERVVIIGGSDKEKEVGKEQGKENENNSSVADESAGTWGQDEENGDNEPSNAEEIQSEKASSSAQKALLLVFERMVEGESEINVEGEASKKPSLTVLRMLVLPTQVGCILGKGGSVIKQTSAESGAHIRILPRDKLPLCALPSDELLQITGGVDAVRKALVSVSKQLLENPPRDRDTFPASMPTGPSAHSFGPPPQPEVFPPKNHHFQGAPPYAAGLHDGVDYHSNAPLPVPKFHDNFNLGRMKSSQDILTFRLLCINEKVGGVIGKGGSIIKTLQHETGCEIKILDGVPDSEDRIIVISAPAHPDDRISAAQDAVLRVQSRIVRAILDSQEKIVLSRLLVSSNQIGCLLGKGGNIIAEMRKSSGAHIRILGKDQIPKCASENEEVVQITGEFEAVQEALLQITSRLRHHLFRDRVPFAMNHPARPPFSDQVPPVAPFMGRRDPSPPRMFSNFNSSFHKFDQVGGLPPNDERPPFAHGRSPSDQRHPFAHGLSPSDQRHPFARGFPPHDERTPFAHGLPPSDERHPPFAPGFPPNDERRPPFAPGLPPNDERPPFSHGLPPGDERHPPFAHSLPSGDERRPFAHGLPPSDERPPPFAHGFLPNDERPPPFEHGYPSSDERHHSFAHGLPPNNEHPPFVHNIQKPRVPLHGSERVPSSASWAPQGVSGSTGIFDHAEGARQRGIGGFGSGSQSATITSTTVEVVVPRALVPSIYGRDGENLKQTRQISGAKITITEPRPEALETVLIIAGTPEQTHAAQSLLQAFVLSGQSSP